MKWKSRLLSNVSVQQGTKTKADLDRRHPTLWLIIKAMVPRKYHEPDISDKWELVRLMQSIDVSISFRAPPSDLFPSFYSTLSTIRLRFCWFLCAHVELATRFISLDCNPTTTLPTHSLLVTSKNIKLDCNKVVGRETFKWSVFCVDSGWILNWDLRKIVEKVENFIWTFLSKLTQFYYFWLQIFRVLVNGRKVWSIYLTVFDNSKFT